MPFPLNDQIIRDLPHVRVQRMAPRAGRPCRYKKTFKPAIGDSGADLYWTQRENEFLVEFFHRKLRHTVQLAGMELDGGGGRTAVLTAIETLDAGVTVEDWLQIVPRPQAGRACAHPFQPVGLFLHLLRACLRALDEIHAHGIVHCDIKPDNICLPYAPYPCQSGPLRIDFERIRLIDFAFALTPARPLLRPLPMLPVGAYQSELLKAALRADSATGVARAVQGLDWRVDLFGLGHFAKEILATGLLAPPGAAGQAALAGAERLVDTLQGYDWFRRFWEPSLRPHAGLIADIDQLLSGLTAADQDATLTPVYHAPPPAAAPTPVAPTPVATPMATPLPVSTPPTPIPNAVELVPPPNGDVGGGRSKGSEATNFSRPQPNPPALEEGSGALTPIPPPPANPLPPKPAPRPALPPVVSIHGWPADKVQALQRQTAAALGRPVLFRDALQSGGEGPAMVVIPAGEFLMGSPEDEPERQKNEGPQHPVRIAQPFALGECAVSFAEFDRFCAATGRKLPTDKWGRGLMPVIRVSWDDAMVYCAWLQHATGQAYRLPSEAEWEYACRAGTVTAFAFGDTISTAQANYKGNYVYGNGVKGEYRAATVPVGEFQPNHWGLRQMHGNVWEWCADAWHDSYQNAPADGRAWLEGGEQGRRVLRGGSWDYYPQDLRSAARGWYSSGFRYSNFGFRIAMTLTP